MSDDPTNAAPLLGVDRKGVPRCVTPWYYGWIARCVASLLALATGLLVAKWLGLIGTRWLGLVINPMMMMTGLVAHWYFYTRHVEALRLRVVQYNLRVCLFCGYVLEGLPDAHRCPECGNAYERESTRRTWEKWLTKRMGFRREWHERAIADRDALRARKTCVRCGEDISNIPSKLCPSCGAKHEFEPAEP